MDSTTAAVLSSWTLDGWIVAPMLVTAGIYLRGWLLLRRRGARRFDARRLAMFLGGLAAIYLALASPIEALAPLLLSAHMVQHLMLIIVAAPLAWLAAPQLPLLVGLPTAIREVWIEPLARQSWLRAGLTGVTRPAAAWTVHTATLWAWHLPQFYDAALRSATWHYLEHACFFGTALLFWWPVVQPYPSRPAFSRWYLLPYLFLAGVQGTVLSAIFTFSDRVLYPHYDLVPRLWGLSALDDQAIAGAIMWIPGSLAYLIPLALVGTTLLYGSHRAAAHKPEAQARRLEAGASDNGWNPSLARRVSIGAQRSIQVRRWDLLAVPLVGRFMRWRHARLAMQLPLLVVAAAVIVDGLLGPPVSPLNLAGVVPWIHWRGLLIVALLAMGNVFCMACPFTAPRGLARRLLGGERAWPHWLRSKWLAIALVVLFFWAYEAFSLWNSPWWTAWIAVAYFVAAFLVEGLFRGAAFCKYVCPIGQFNFVQSLLSPWEVRVREPGMCVSCKTKDCIRGRESPSPLVGEGRARGTTPILLQAGCGLDLYQPHKSGNMDCTFCLDCVRACTHENVGVLAIAPGSALWGDEHRSGIGRYSRRPDLAALVVILVFAAFVNAAGMVKPVVALEDRIAISLGWTNRLPIVTAAMFVGLVAAPTILVATAALASRWLAGAGVSWRVAALWFAYALAPIGCGMWLAHYGFHLLTSADAIVPAVCRVAADAGFGEAVRAPLGSCCSVKAGHWLLRLEITFLDVGLLGSLYVAWRIAREMRLTPGRVLRAFAPWAALIVLLFAAGVWIVLQPMEMRGTMEVGM